jgi:three-Cys-motif partner protein
LSKQDGNDGQSKRWYIAEMRMARLDEVGYWSEVKLDIVRKYASAYSIIMNKQRGIRRYLYADGFGGAGVHISKSTGDFILGSPMNALNVTPPFHEYHFIDLDHGRAESLKDIAGNRDDVFVYEGDCNKKLLESVFPRARYEDYHRALCLLDPYGLHLDWEVIEAAGRMRSIEIFLNFPVMDMNMNVLWHDRSKVKPEQAARMDRFWGDDSWPRAAYRKSQGLFDKMEEKVGNPTIARAFQKRLREVAGFK